MRGLRPLGGLLALALLACLALASQVSAEPTAARSNILVLSLDTFRGDALGEATPNLNRLAAESLVFTRAHANANETLFSHASMFTSRYPSELGPVDYSFSFPSSVTTVAEALSARI
jgi:arylsulfatase A-like enzyme